MRVLFYLPVITPWWFERIIVPLLEKLVVDHEVHILAPIFWQGTGVGQAQYDQCEHMSQLCWHVVNDRDHVSMRTKAKQADAIIDFVKNLNPDFTLCRSADFETPRQFPGLVRHITEGGADPLLLPVGAVHFTKEPFAHGLLPELRESEIDQLETLIEPYWQPMVEAHAAQTTARDDFRKWAKLPTDRPILFLPLEYEHGENFYTAHRKGAVPNARMVEELIGQVDERVFVAMTNHPLNELYVDNSALEMLAATYPDRLALLPGETPSGHRTTPSMMRAADGVLLGDTKAFSLAAFCGTPILRLSHFETGSWLNACEELDVFVDALLQGEAVPPDAETARTWFTYHAANNLVSPRHLGPTADDILKRMTLPHDPTRWERNLAVFAKGWERSEQVLT